MVAGLLECIISSLSRDSITVLEVSDRAPLGLPDMPGSRRGADPGTGATDLLDPVGLGVSGWEHRGEGGLRGRTDRCLRRGKRPPDDSEEFLINPVLVHAEWICR